MAKKPEATPPIIHGNGDFPEIFNGVTLEQVRTWLLAPEANSMRDQVAKDIFTNVLSDSIGNTPVDILMDPKEGPKRVSFTAASVAEAAYIAADEFMREKAKHK